MPHIKNALIRYRVIDKLLNNPYKTFPTKIDLCTACEEELYGEIGGTHISESTIEKDLFAMREEMDAPIAYSKKNKGYYYTDPDFTINQKPLSEEDVGAIQFALSTLAQFQETTFFQQFGTALGKVIDHVNIKLLDKEEVTSSIIQFEKSSTVRGSDYLIPLIDAIKQQYLVYFTYESFISQQKKNRKTTPLLLKEYDGRWYLISYDAVKEKVITYALDRMYDLEIVEQKGIVPVNFDADRYFKYAIGITANEDTHPEKIILKANSIASKYINSKPFHESQEVMGLEGDNTIFEIFAIVSEELIRQILSYAGEIEVLSPLVLRNEIQHRVEELKNLYLSK